MSQPALRAGANPCAHPLLGFGESRKLFVSCALKILLQPCNKTWRIVARTVYHRE